MRMLLGPLLFAFSIVAPAAAPTPDLAQFAVLITAIGGPLGIVLTFVASRRKSPEDYESLDQRFRKRSSYLRRVLDWCDDTQERARRADLELLPFPSEDD